ncbi:McrB family protein [Flavobacterium sp. GP15]|uniref:McrB family protein n=1 Tax=Flavobacterium sp. GP15 TaxID=2758567 RepID=UPI00165DF3E1|nr:AAA family ATPase [Flavobacterium sp. GP15]
MELIGEKIIRLQDAKYKIQQNNSNEASIFIAGDLAEKLNLSHESKITFNISKENAIKLLCFTFSYKKLFYKKQDRIILDIIWFQKMLDLINKHYKETSWFTFEVKKQSQERFYFITIQQPSGLNIRDLFIQDHVKLIFKKEIDILIIDIDFSNEEYIDSTNEPLSDNILLNENIHITNKNTIYYGAPGTGKSHKVDKIIEELKPKYYERITFHPEYDNSSFIGGYKPISVLVKHEDNGMESFSNEVHYKFVPQAFTNIYKRAWQDLDNQYYLVIEEINRGNCAEIFGEIFQLLDRTSNYTVTPSKELKEYLKIEAFKDESHLGIINGLKLPPNLSILATMNTSDQSLFPMDSAFKRRWDWEYIPICYNPKDDFGNDNDSFDFEIDIDIEDGKKYSWIKFIEKINLNHIKNNPSLGMDKCIGNYFIKPDNDITISLKPFINKVIFYLWNDVFKDEDNKVFEENTSYEDFFPMNINGKKKIKELFDRIELQPKKSLVIIEDDSELGQVAEDTEAIES